MVSSHTIVLMWEKCNWEKNESKKPFADFGTLHHHSLSHDLLKFYEAGSDTLTTTSLGFVRANIYGEDVSETSRFLKMKIVLNELVY